MDGLGSSSDESTFERTHAFPELKPVERGLAGGGPDSLLLDAIGEVERSAGPESAQLLPGLAALASARIARGELESAASVVLRALDIGDKSPDGNRPDLVPLLTDLTRLSLKHGLHALAEPLLLRLLEMKRHKGEDHPEVATVLASLAAVRQAQGHHESAEQLWRRVLEIRERTLAPNHFAIATALERLADSCAARGKNAEALELFQRAYGMRERTLGVGHSSLRVSLEKIADLQLQASEDLTDSLDTSIGAITYAPPTFRPSQPAAPSPAAGVPQYQVATVKKPASLVINPAPTAVTVKASAPLAEWDRPSHSGEPARPQSPYRDLLLSIEKDLEDEDGLGNAPTKWRTLAGSIVELVSQRRKAVAVGAGVVVVLFLAFAADSRAGTDPQGDTGVAPVQPSTAAGAPTSASALTIPIRAEPKPAAETVRASIANFITGKSKSSETRSERNPEGKAATPPKVAIPKVSENLVAGAALVARSITAPAAALPDPIVSMPLGSGTRLNLSSADYTENAGPTRARLIGSLPVPRVPDQISDAQGEVRVGFRVDTMGRPVMSTFSVARSPNELLTAAIRRLIPDLRFEPARTGGANPKPAVDSVEIGFKFVRK